MLKLNIQLVPLFWIYFTVVLALSILPINSAGELNNITIVSFRSDYVLHVFMFLPWAFFGNKLNKNYAYWLLLGLLFAAATEGIQYLLIYRSFNVNDLAANMLGIILGLLIFGSFKFVRKN